jgi:UDP-glucose 4-epimerase
MYLCMVDGSRWEREVGWRPHYALRDTIRSVVAQG